MEIISQIVGALSDSTDGSVLLSEWLAELRKMVHPGQRIFASVQESKKGEFRVMFRTRYRRRDLVAEITEFALVDAINRAGSLLLKQIIKEKQRRGDSRKRIEYFKLGVA